MTLKHAMEDADAESVLVERDGAVATVILNNPEKRNAMNRASWDVLADTIEALSNDLSLRCIVIRGAGEKAFAAGADIKEFPEMRANAAQAIEYGDATKRAIDALLHCTHPTVAMIYGACTGGGLEIAACCDLRIASDKARFGVPINRIGHAFAPPEMKPVLDLVGKAVVLEILLEGQVFDAETAYAKGLLTRIVPDDKLADEVAETVARITAGAPLAARMTKKLVNRFMDDPAPLSDEEIKESYAPCDSADYREGFTAFMEKRTPEFKGE